MSLKANLCVGVCVVAMQIFLPNTVMAGDEVLASSDGITITKTDFLGEIQALPETGRAELLSDAKRVNMLVRNMLIRRVLAQRAESAKLSATPVASAALKLAQERVLADMWMAKIAADQPESDEAALDKLARAAYVAEDKAFLMPDQRRVRHILVAAATENAEEKAKALLARLRAGENFETLAQEHSADPGSAKKGGDLGLFSKGRMIKAFEDAAFSMKTPGELAGPIETKFGWHILKLEEIRPAGKVPYDEVADNIRRQIKEKKLAERQEQEVVPIDGTVKLEEENIKALIKPRLPPKAQK